MSHRTARRSLHTVSRTRPHRPRVNQHITHHTALGVGAMVKYLSTTEHPGQGLGKRRERSCKWKGGLCGATASPYTSVNGSISWCLWGSLVAMGWKPLPERNTQALETSAYNAEASAFNSLVNCFHHPSNKSTTTHIFSTLFSLIKKTTPCSHEEEKELIFSWTWLTHLKYP